MATIQDAPLAFSSETINEKSSAQALRTLFRKTKVCNFFSSGCCKKGTKCKFAHSLDELKPQPNLCNTKLCPALSGYGLCGGGNCKYAHHESEIRPPSALEEEQTLAHRQWTKAINSGNSDNLYLHTPSHDGTNSTTCFTLMSTSRSASECTDDPSNTASISVEHFVPRVVESSKSKDNFLRTKLCNFYGSGTCHQGNSCKFAHGWNQLEGSGGTLAGGMDFGETGQVPAGFTDGISSDCWNLQPFKEVEAPQPIYDAVKVVPGLPPAGFTGQHGELVVQNTFLSIVPSRPSRRSLSLPTVMKADA